MGHLTAQTRGLLFPVRSIETLFLGTRDHFGDSTVNGASGRWALQQPQMSLSQGQTQQGFDGKVRVLGIV